VSKDIEETFREAEEMIGDLETMARQRLEDAEQKIKKGIVKGVLWIALTIAIYFIWGTTWYFWVLFALNVITIGGVIFAKVMIAKAKKKISESDDDATDYDFDADIVEDEEEMLIDCTTKLFGEAEYSSEDGVDFDEITLQLNGRETHLSGIIFEDLTEVQIEKAVVLVDSLEELDAKARLKWLELLREEDEEVCGFIDVHYNEYGEEIKSKVLDKLQVKEQNDVLFIRNLELGSFHIIEGEDEDSVEIVMDYSLIWEEGSSFTDQILAMHFTDKLEYAMHTHDS